MQVRPQVSKVSSVRPSVRPPHSEAGGATLQRPGRRHRGNVLRAALSGERGLPRLAVPLVPQQRGAAPGPQDQPPAHQLHLHHQPGHWEPGGCGGGANKVQE